VKKNIILLFLLLSINALAQQKGVDFVKNGNLKTVFDLAKAQNKPVFIEVFLPTCHVCQAFIPTFDNPQTGTYFNKNFVSYKLDINSEEARGFLAKQNIWIPSLPCMLFFDKDVNFIHHTLLGENLNTVNFVVEAGQAALSPNNKSAVWKASFQSGNRDENFLIEYGQYARIVKDTNDNISAMREYAKLQKPNEMSNNTNFLVLQKLIIDDENPLAKYLLAHLPEFYGKYDKKLVISTAENIMMYSLYSSRGNKYDERKINELKANLAKIGVDAKSIQGRVWMTETAMLFRTGQTQKALVVIDSLLSGKNGTKENYAFLCNYVKMRTQDPVALKKAQTWCNLGK
jgi:thioredoxin-related protein